MRHDKKGSSGSGNDGYRITAYGKERNGRGQKPYPPFFYGKQSESRCTYGQHLPDGTPPIEVVEKIRGKYKN